MLFEWDELKRQENIKERGVDFITAAQIFANDLIVEAVDTRKDYGEIRIRALGMVDDGCYLVTYTWRGEHRRIISAVRVNDNGKKRYQAILTRRT